MPRGLLYVGKARNLRRRLASYRVSPIRTLSRAAGCGCSTRRGPVDWEITSDEAAAIALERELLRTLHQAVQPGRSLARPSKSHGGRRDCNCTWRFWRMPRKAGTRASRWELAALEARGIGPAACGSSGWTGPHRNVFLRLGRGPASRDRIPATSASAAISVVAAGFARRLGQWSSGDPAPWMEWIQTALPKTACPFVRALMAADLETIIPKGAALSS
ncbi:MAG: hypothetical protein KIT22_03860 [Verrucomicrobiae bacterium]|nr:hypothetical protein [Verrucomicrobiae bacterium]